MPPNRIEQTTVATTATDKDLGVPTPPTSPTGTPVLRLPAWLVPWILVLITAAGVVLALPSQGVPVPPLVSAIAVFVIAIGGALGIASPGWRKDPAPTDSPTPPPSSGSSRGPNP